MSRTTTDLSRRDAVKAIAAGSVITAAVSTVAMGATTDPAFAAIERHRNAFAAYLATFDPYNEAERVAWALPKDSPERKAAQAVADARHLDQCRFASVADAVAYEMADTRPTTLASAGPSRYVGRAGIGRCRAPLALRCRRFRRASCTEPDPRPPRRGKAPPIECERRSVDRLGQRRARNTSSGAWG